MPVAPYELATPSRHVGHLTYSELKEYLPHFDSECDPQVGEWVMVTPPRFAALLDPLITMWERQPPDTPSDIHFLLPGSYSPIATARSHAIPFRYPLSEFAQPPSGGATRSSMLVTPQLAPLSTAKGMYCHRKRGRSVAASADDDVSSLRGTIGEEGILYLHVRLGLLTRSTPAVFGGSDAVEALIIRTSDGRQTPEVVMIQLLSGTAKQGQHASLLPEWCRSVEDDAAEELVVWLNRDY